MVEFAELFQDGLQDWPEQEKHMLDGWPTKVNSSKGICYLFSGLFFFNISSSEIVKLLLFLWTIG